MTAGKYVVLYDDQCEVCQACISWLRLLDHGGKTLCVPIDPDQLLKLEPRLQLEDCLKELHVITPEGKVTSGWAAVALLARRFPSTWIIGALGSVPPFSWTGRLLYRFVARNRYALSKCRGGVCRAARPEQVQSRSPLAVFWSCYSFGMLVRLPLVLGSWGRALLRRLIVFARQRRNRLDLMEGKLRIFFLGGFPCDLIPLVFGELFTAVLYDGLLIDPGSPRMRRSLRHHLRPDLVKQIRGIVATHHHEEHAGNLDWLAEQLAVPLYVSKETARLLQPPKRLPWIRSIMIGQPPPLESPFELLADRVPTTHGSLEVLSAPGHCNDHIALYDRNEKLLLAGDAFMGSYFSTPNPDVDSRLWMQTLERFLELDIDVLVEGHGHIHTLRADIPNVPGVVFRQDPKEALRTKLSFLRWLREQIQTGVEEDLPARAIEATCFPWGHTRSWEGFLYDELTRLCSAGHFSRSELVRSFVRQVDGQEILPTVYRVRFYR